MSLLSWRVWSCSCNMALRMSYVVSCHTAGGRWLQAQGACTARLSRSSFFFIGQDNCPQKVIHLSSVLNTQITSNPCSLPSTGPDVCRGLCDRRRQWHPTPILLPGKSHGQRSLVGCSPWGREESDTTERLHFHFSLSCTGEGHGNPLQCSCLENPRDVGAW